MSPDKQVTRFSIDRAIVKIDGRILNIPSRESASHRLLCAQRGNVKLSESTPQDTQENDAHRRQIIADLHREEISKVCFETSGLSYDLHSSTRIGRTLKPHQSFERRALRLLKPSAMQKKRGR
jgi:hypothetical protein